MNPALTPPNSPQDSVDAVLGQYTGAAAADKDRRFDTTYIEVLPSVGEVTPVATRRQHVRDRLYPNLGSSGGRISNDESAASELEDK